MKPETMNITIAIISALATVAAAFIYYWTLNELKRQRENTSRPHLFIDKTHFYVQGVKKENIILPIIWSPEFKNSVIIEFSNDFNIAEFQLKCFNIGFGAATNVEIEFSYDIDEFLYKIKQLEKEISENDRIKIDRNSAFISFSPANDKMPQRKFGLAIDNNLKHYISYILPVTITNDSVDLKLPSHYLELLNVYVYYFMKGDKREGMDLSTPSITTKIDYLDINSKKSEERFTIVTKFTAVSLAGYSGTFELHKLK